MISTIRAKSVAMARILKAKPTPFSSIPSPNHPPFPSSVSLPLVLLLMHGEGGGILLRMMAQPFSPCRLVGRKWNDGQRNCSR